MKLSSLPRVCRWIARAALLGVVVLGSSFVARADDNWPQFLGPSGDAHSDAVGLPVEWSETKNVAWKVPLPGKSWSSPVVWGQQVWMTNATPEGHELFAVCLDRDSGKIIHNFKLFDVEKPSEIHVFNSYASPSPVIEEGRVWLTFGSYGTACLDTRTAEVIWSRRDLPCEHFRGPGSSPILYGDLFILHYDGFDYQYVVALNKHTGQTVWKTDRQVDYGTDNGDFKKAFCTPQVFEINGQPQLISPTSKAALAYDPLTGQELWRVRYEGFSATAKPILGKGLIYIDTGFSKADLLAVRTGGRGDITDTHIAWTATKAVPSKPTPLLIDDLLFMIHDQGTATCLDAATGKVLWQKRVPGNFTSTPLYAEGRIYMFNEEGQSTVIKASAEYEELAVNTLPEGCLASPAVTGRAMLLRTRGALYRLETPALTQQSTSRADVAIALGE